MDACYRKFRSRPCAPRPLHAGGLAGLDCSTARRPRTRVRRRRGERTLGPKRFGTSDVAGSAHRRDDRHSDMPAMHRRRSNRVQRVANSRSPSAIARRRLVAACSGSGGDLGPGRRPLPATAAAPQRPLRRRQRSRSPAGGGARHDRLVAHHQRRPGQDRSSRRSPTPTWRPTRTSRSTSPSSRTRRSRPSSPTQMQSGTPPDLFQSWGGGTMAAQVDAGMLKDITADVASGRTPSTPVR